MTLASIPPPTGFGTVPCKKWPTFYLQNYNPVSRSTYLQSFGLGDIQPKADVTVVGLYFADSDASQEAIQFQDRIAYSLHDYNVHNVAINFYAPRICALKECEATWSFNKFLYYTNSCENYIGGCEPGIYSLFMTFI